MYRRKVLPNLYRTLAFRSERYSTLQNNTKCQDFTYSLMSLKLSFELSPAELHCIVSTRINGRNKQYRCSENVALNLSFQISKYLIRVSSRFHFQRHSDEWNREPRVLICMTLMLHAVADMYGLFIASTAAHSRPPFLALVRCLPSLMSKSVHVFLRTFMDIVLSGCRLLIFRWPHVFCPGGRPFAGRGAKATTWTVSNKGRSKNCVQPS